MSKPMTISADKITFVEFCFASLERFCVPAESKVFAFRITMMKVVDFHPVGLQSAINAYSTEILNTLLLDLPPTLTLVAIATGFAVAIVVSPRLAIRPSLDLFVKVLHRF
jgi:hypothetical protein